MRSETSTVSGPVVSVSPRHGHIAVSLCRCALGAKTYAAAAKADLNNPPGTILLNKHRAVIAHFQKSAKAAQQLRELQLAALARRPAVFPFDRPAKSLRKPRRSRPNGTAK